MLCTLLLNGERGILHAIFTKFHRLLNGSAAHVQTCITIATYIHYYSCHGHRLASYN